MKGTRCQFNQNLLVAIEPVNRSPSTFDMWPMDWWHANQPHNQVHIKYQFETTGMCFHPQMINKMKNFSELFNYILLKKLIKVIPDTKCQ